jgi:outer membrane protein assembly factor BamD
MRRYRTVWITLLAAALLGGCSGRRDAAAVPGTSAEPDKVLFERAANDIKHGKYIQGRLDLQTLINTYPDSEYLAKAKLAIGDSYYKEGGVAGLKQAIAEYKDFITFFPFLDEAAYAQMQVGMAHYRMMEKPDRDHSEAVSAEAELQTFLEKYPNNPLVPQAKQHLREVQEVLAEGNFRVARFYFIRGVYRAAGARLLELTNRYPLYSQADQANWMLGQIYEKAERNDYAGKYYARIVREYPLSPLVADAKQKLQKFGVPVPQPDPTAVARMQKEQETRHGPGLVARSMGIFRTKPDVSMAAAAGDPTMTPASETGDETLSLGPPPTLAAGGGSGRGSSATVETVTPGSTAALAQPSADSTAPSSPSSSNSADPSTSQTSSDPAAAQAAQSGTTAPPADKSQESTSKKKKGLHKIIPW